MYLLTAAWNSSYMGLLGGLDTMTRRERAASTFPADILESYVPGRHVTDRYVAQLHLFAEHVIVLINYFTTGCNTWGDVTL